MSSYDISLSVLVRLQDLAAGVSLYRSDTELITKSDLVASLDLGIERLMDDWAVFLQKRKQEVNNDHREIRSPAERINQSRA